MSINTLQEKGLDNYWIPSIPQSALFGTKLADDFIQVNIGGDLALMNGVLKLLVSWGSVDHDFIDAHTTGWSDLSGYLETLEMSELVKQSGVSLDKIEWLATLIARSKTMVTVYSMGLTQHKFGTQNVMWELTMSPGISICGLGAQKTIWDLKTISGSSK